MRDLSLRALRVVLAALLWGAILKVIDRGLWGGDFMPGFVLTTLGSLLCFAAIEHRRPVPFVGAWRRETPSVQE